MFTYDYKSTLNYVTSALATGADVFLCGNPSSDVTNAETGEVDLRFNNGYIVTNKDMLLKVTTLKKDDKTGITYFDGEPIGHRTVKELNSVYLQLPLHKFHLATPTEIEELSPKKKVKIEKKYSFKSSLTIIKYEDGTVESTFNTDRKKVPETDEKRLRALEAVMKSAEDAKKAKEEFNVVKFVRENAKCKIFGDLFDVAKFKKSLADLINFFSEFQFEPAQRFTNTLALKCAKDVKEGKKYIVDYFKLSNNACADAIADKIKSPEFEMILNTLATAEPSKIENKRLKIYYGSAGTGKTTMAMEEADGRCVICNNSILPQDLIEDFNFDDGKAGFQKSILRTCMEEGKPIVLDEINLCPFQTIRFLQGILDNKKSFVWKGETINIKEGFSIIGTMNLVVGGATFGLSEPLVDRCADIKEFRICADNLMSAIM